MPRGAYAHAVEKVCPCLFPLVGRRRKGNAFQNCALSSVRQEAGVGAAREHGRLVTADRCRWWELMEKRVLFSLIYIIFAARKAAFSLGRQLSVDSREKSPCERLKEK